jgi:hypothetical protein
LSARWSYYSETGYDNRAKMAYLSLSAERKKDKQESFTALEQGIKKTIQKYNELGIIPYCHIAGSAIKTLSAKSVL